jgi:ribonuclease-3
MTGDLAVLEGAIGHRFTDRALLERALTHKSRAHEVSGQTAPGCDNEQLEFLGDAILGFLVSESLVRRFPDAGEGRLSKLKAHLVSAAHLHRVAQELGLGDYLYLGRGEERSGGRAKKTLLSDALEALIAGMYLDGGLAPARSFIEARIVGEGVFAGAGAESSVHDYKSALQEAAQSLALPPPRYTTTNEEGPDHSKLFTVEVRLGTAWVARAQGPSKKEAGQKAAREILRQIAAAGT